MDFSPQQQEAVHRVKDWMESGDEPVYYLAGYAGTGKTTIAKHLASLCGGRTVFCAYTGKAALVMRQNGCPEAMTIHQAIYKAQGDGGESKEVTAIREELAGLEN